MPSSTLPNGTPKVLIVGAGPSGEILALSLLKNGIPVRLIEKSPIPRIGQRGAGITQRTMEVFDFLGVAGEVASRAMPPHLLRIYQMPEGKETLKEIDMLPPLPPTPDVPYLDSRLLGQDKLDKIFRAEMVKYGGTVEMGVELQTLEQVDDHVKVKLLKHGGTIEEASYEYVVGADGAKGVVRKLLGLSFLGQTTAENFVVGDIKLEGLSADRWHSFGEFGQIITTFRPTEDPGVFSFFMGGSKLENHSDIIATDDTLKTFIKKHIGTREDLTLGEVICASHYTTNIRMTETFGKGRVFLTGDAAHIHSPTGGQGMNTGIQDSFNLGWKLGLVVRGLAPSSLLDSFTKERIPVVAEMLNLTTLILNRVLAESTDDAGWKRSGNLHQLGVNYRSSTITIDEENLTSGKKVTSSAYDKDPEEFVQAGDRAPDAPGLVKYDSGSNGSTTRLFKLFSPTRHTILLFANKIDPDYKDILSILGKYSNPLVRVVVVASAGSGSHVLSDSPLFDTFEDRDGHAYDAYKGPNGTSALFIIRPDGIVGARVGQKKYLEAYFQGIFGNM